MDINQSHTLDAEAKRPETHNAKCGELGECDKEIARLQLQLAVYQARRQEILKKSLTPQKSATSIQSLPDELLLVIFEHRIAYEHFRIVDLLFVCRRWYTLTMHSTKLWARLQIKPRFPDTEDVDWDAYVSACLSRSTHIPLYVSIDLTHFWTRQNFFAEVATAALQQYVDKDSFADILDRLREMDLDVDSSRYEYFLSNTMDSIASAVGDNGQHMQRWKSLYLKFSDQGSEIDQWVWRKLYGPAVAMEELTVMGLGAFIESDDDSTDYSDEDHGISFPSLTSLSLLSNRHTDHIAPLYALAINHSSLRHLTYTMPFGWNQIKDLSPFTHLESLELHCAEGEHPLMATGEVFLRLTRLRKLTLSGSLSFTPLVTLDLPSLRHLHIIRHSPTRPGLTNMVPLGPGVSTALRVSPRHVTWTVARRYRKQWEETDLITALKDVFQEYQTADSITVAEFAREAVEKIHSGSVREPQPLAPPRFAPNMTPDEYARQA